MISRCLALIVVAALLAGCSRLWPTSGQLEEAKQKAEQAGPFIKGKELAKGVEGASDKGAPAGKVDLLYGGRGSRSLKQLNEELANILGSKKEAQTGEPMTTTQTGSESGLYDLKAAWQSGCPKYMNARHYQLWAAAVQGGASEFNAGNYAKARKWLEPAIGLSDQFDGKDIRRYSARIQLSEVYVAESQYDAAIAVLEQALNIARESGAEPMVSALTQLIEETKAKVKG
ncbi:MAG TPA: tetratricopeptide repeat protein [Candidatus Obscuribacterales bacterium]